MAVLGSGGVLELSRETPQPLALAIARFNATASPPSISLANQGYWTGDRVVIASSDGLPFDVNEDGYADCPDGHAIYRGSQWLTGPARAFYTGADTDSSDFYHYGYSLLTQDGDAIVTQSGDTLLFPGLAGGEDWYNQSATTGLASTFDAYIYRDELDRITFFPTENAAYTAEASDRIEMKKVNFGNFVIAAYSANAGYTAAMNSVASSVDALTLINSEQSLEQTITMPALFDTLCETDRTWVLQCGLQEWALSIDAANLDTTAIGDTFGENVKALVRGAGTLQFIVDHRDQANELDAMTLLRLVLLTENQCNTNAKFYLYKNRNEVGTQINGSAYYQCDVLLTNTRVNTRATDLIAGTADFVATSEIKLKVAA
tara:strand:- start:3016 stop:4137 length:1122 start_codon:yes stop_codon:yes gene_type:complete